MIYTDEEVAAEVQRGIKSILSNVDPKVDIGIEILSSKNGKVLFSKNANTLFKPASCMKLFTAATALGILGPSFCFETDLFLDENKNLYVHGSGDPEFSFADLGKMIDELSLQNIVSVQDIFLDVSAFDDLYEESGIVRHEDDMQSALYSKVGALNIDHNCASMWVAPTKKEESPKVVFVPKEYEINIQNNAKTTESGLALTVSKHQELMLIGNIGLDQQISQYSIPVEDPHHYFGSLMQQSLQKRGIEIKGKIQTGKIPKGAKKIATHNSSALPILLYPILKASDNLYADAIFKKLGERMWEVGSWQTGKKVCREYLSKKLSVDVADFAMFDGSGRSHSNAVSPHHLVELLKAIQQETGFYPEILSALPIGGIDGTLKNRMKDGKSTYNIRAKSGALTHISSLAGYVTSKNGDEFIFAMISRGLENFPGNFKEQVEDKIAQFLGEM